MSGPVPVPPGMMVQTGDPSVDELYTPLYTTLDIEIAYQPDAAPYVGSAGPFADVWKIFDDNAAALFQGSTKTVTVPHALKAMRALPSAGSKEDYTVKDLIDLVTEHRSEASGGGKASFFVVFIDGYFYEGERLTNVLGVSLGGTTLIFMFKPVIKGTATLLRPNVDRFVEQATLVHEFGHAIGLVNNGVALTSLHQDAQHGKHCSNPDCGMYYANEGAGAAADFLDDYFKDQSTLLFDEACLDDVHAKFP